MTERLARWYTQQGLDIRDVVLPNREIMRGLHATRDFSPGQTVFILEWEPRQDKGVYQGREGKLVPFGKSYDSDCGDRGIPVSRKWVFCPYSSHPLYWYNHSCEPNTAVTQFGPIKKKFRGNRFLEFKAIRPIKKGEHLTIDYASFSSINCGDAPGLPYHLECACGSKNCRGQTETGVTGWAHEEPPTQVRLFLAGAVLAYLVDEGINNGLVTSETLRHLFMMTARTPNSRKRYHRALDSQQRVGT